LCFTHYLFHVASLSPLILFFVNDTATTEIYTLSLHDALPISNRRRVLHFFDLCVPKTPSVSRDGSGDCSPEEGGEWGGMEMNAHATKLQAAENDLKQLME